MSQSRSINKSSFKDRGEPSTLKKKKTVAIHEMERNDRNSSPEMEGEEDYGEEEDMGDSEHVEEEDDMMDEGYGSTFEKQ